MLDDTIFEAILEIKNLLKEKFPSRNKRILYLLLISLVITIPIFIFDYWIGRISGIILVSIIVLIILSSSKAEDEDESSN